MFVNYRHSFSGEIKCRSSLFLALSPCSLFLSLSIFSLSHLPSLSYSSSFPLCLCPSLSVTMSCSAADKCAYVYKYSQTIYLDITLQRLNAHPGRTVSIRVSKLQKKFLAKEWMLYFEDCTLCCIAILSVSLIAHSIAPLQIVGLSTTRSFMTIELNASLSLCRKDRLRRRDAKKKRGQEKDRLRKREAKKKRG